LKFDPEAIGIDVRAIWSLSFGDPMLKDIAEKACLSTTSTAHCL